MLQAQDAPVDEGAVDHGGVLAQPGARHPNARLVAPLWLGDSCEGLSGLYAAINGIRLAFAHQRKFTAPEVHLLMRCGLRFLSGRLTPEQCVVNGLRIQLWRALVESLAGGTWRQTGLPIAVERIHVEQSAGRQFVFDTLEEAIARYRVPLILERGGHYGVVSGVTASSLLLFDSRGACWISKRACGVPTDGEHLRHLLHPSAFLALNV